MARELVLTSYGVRVGIVDDTGEGICARLRETLPPDVPADGAGPPDVCYVIQRSGGAPGAGPASYDVVCGGDVGLRARTADEVVEWLRGEIDGAVALRSRAALFVHAGVVGWRGRAIVVPGRSATGKSTLVAALVRRSATYYSDEFAVLDDEGRVHPYARVPVLRDASGLAAARGTAGPAGAASRHPLPVSLIVSTTYREGAAWCLEVVRGALAVLPIIDNTLLARVEPERTLRLSARLAPTAVTLQGVRPDAEIAAPKILEFLDGMLEGRPEAMAAERHAAPRERAQAPARAIQAFERIIRARYLRLDNVLDPDEHARLLDYALAHEADFAVSSVIAPDNTYHVDPEFRRSGTLFGFDELWGFLERRLRGLVPHVRQELGLPWFPVGRIERQMAVHQEGGFFGAHTDDGREVVAGRRLTCVYYFHGQPQRFSGGELRLYDSLIRAGRTERAETYVSVEPADNTAVFFPSNLFHEVRPVRRETEAFRDSRFSVNVWFWRGPAPRWGFAENPHRPAG